VIRLSELPRPLCSSWTAAFPFFDVYLYRTPRICHYDEPVIVVRPATVNDISAARSLAERGFAELRRFYRPKLPASAADSANCVVAEIDGRVAGTALFAIEADRLHLWALAADPEVRGIGVARALLAHLGDTAMAARLRALSLCTIQQTGNVAMFERLGFRGIRDEPATWALSQCGESLVEVLMEKAVL
jgi:N-acetylglutamate synthase-like GNAT family acetyltransferase